MWFQKKYWVQENLRSKKNLGTKRFWVQKNFGYKKIFGPKKLCVEKLGLICKVGNNITFVWLGYLS